MYNQNYGPQLYLSFLEVSAVFLFPVSLSLSSQRPSLSYIFDIEYPAKTKAFGSFWRPLKRKNPCGSSPCVHLEHSWVKKNELFECWSIIMLSQEFPTHNCFILITQQRQEGLVGGTLGLLKLTPTDTSICNANHTSAKSPKDWGLSSPVSRNNGASPRLAASLMCCVATPERSLRRPVGPNLDSSQKEGD